jgi:hypothetical protein
MTAHELTLTEWGWTADEIERKARTTCDEFFGNVAYTLVIESRPMARSHSGDVVQYEATINARRGT